MTPAAFDRESIRAWIEEATGEGLRVADPLPDTLAATAESLGMEAMELKIWIYAHEAEARETSWSMDALARWARRKGFARAVCGHCGLVVAGDAGAHVCEFPPEAA